MNRRRCYSCRCLRPYVHERTECVRTVIVCVCVCMDANGGKKCGSLRTVAPRAWYSRRHKQFHKNEAKHHFRTSRFHTLSPTSNDALCVCVCAPHRNSFSPFRFCLMLKMFSFRFLYRFALIALPANTFQFYSSVVLCQQMNDTEKKAHSIEFYFMWQAIKMICTTYSFIN